MKFPEENKLEKIIYNYFWKRRVGMLRFLVLSTIIFLLSYFPYLNLILRKDTLVVITSSLFLLFVVREVKLSLGFIFFLFFISMFLLVFDFTDRAELFINWAYSILFVIVIRMVFS